MVGKDFHPDPLGVVSAFAGRHTHNTRQTSDWIGL
jgi:hypothetical protein